MRFETIRNRLATADARRLAFVALGVAGALALAGFFLAAHQARARLVASVAVLRQQTQALDRQADEVLRLRQARSPAVPVGDLRAAVQAQAQAGGVAGAVVRIDVLDANRVQVIFGTIAFADWLVWVAGLELRQLWVESCRIEAAQVPGMVSVTVILARGGS